MILLFIPTLAAAGFVSDYIENKVNYSIDPCDDFYDHVCSAAIVDNQFLMLKRMEYFNTLLEQQYSPELLEFYRRVKNDLENLPSTTLPQDLISVELFFKNKNPRQDCFDDNTTILLFEGMMKYDAYYRLQKTPFFDTLKKKMTDIFAVMKEIQIKEFAEAPWTPEYPEMLNRLKNITIGHLDATDLQLERELKGIKMKYEECLGRCTNPSNKLASICISYAVCSTKRKMTDNFVKHYFQSFFWENFKLQYHATYFSEVNVVMISPMYYTFEEDELPFVMGSVDFILGHEIGHVFFNISGVVPSNSECVRRHMKHTCDSHFNQEFCSYDQIGIPGNYQRLGDDAADFVGVHATLKAFKNYFPNVAEKNSKDELNEISRKFFYGNAIHWCYSNPAHSDAEHSPFKVRINGINSLFAEFSDAFQCKRGSNMAKAGTCLPFSGLGAPTQSLEEPKMVVCTQGKDTINGVTNNVFFWNPQKGHHEWGQTDMYVGEFCVIGFTPNCEIRMSVAPLNISKRDKGCHYDYRDGNVHCFCNDGAFCNSYADKFAPQAMEAFRAVGLDYNNKCPSKLNVPGAPIF